VKGININMTTKITLLALLLTANAHGQGTILWNESVNGPFSGDFAHPTSLSPLQAGTNSIIGMSEVVPVGNNWFGSPDFFTFAIPSDLVVSEVHLQIDKPNVWTWIGEPSYVNQLAFAGSPSTGDLLAQWGISAIGPGAYGMYLANLDQQAVTSIASYRLDFFVQNIPEPSTLSLLLVGAGFVGFCSWRKSLRRRQ
jgi:hypothetical protein